MKLAGWGRYPVIDAQVVTARDDRHAAATIQQPGALIARGLGRSYGDASLNERALHTGRLNYFLDFDGASGLLTAESGVTLAEITRAFLPRGWALATTPGTWFVTLGGAIAGDVHGKNHHIHGCFSECVEWFDLLLADGATVRCSRGEHADLFLATCGGMGLTGVITRAALRLRRIPGSIIAQTTVKAANLDDTLALFEEHARAPYSVAWIDCLAGGSRLGRSLLMSGEEMDDGRYEVPAPVKLNVPFDCPSYLLNSYSVRLFNFLYYERVRRRRVTEAVGYGKFFYPLDAIANWNRLYGASGFVQYQFVAPKEASRSLLKEVLRKISAAGKGSFLAVLKLMGKENENLLSFPMAGYTLALDFKAEPGLWPLLDSLDQLVAAHGGRLYLAKDARMPPALLRSGYPRLERFQALREKYGLTHKFSSLLSRRLEM